MTLSNAAVNGPHLSNIQPLIDAVNNFNQFSRAASISAAGNNQAGATQLSKVLNELDTVASSTGVILPATGGAASSTPFQFCIVINNGANAVTVYGNGSDTINGTAGSTGVSQAAGKTALYVSAQKGAWFRLLSA